MKLFVRGTHSFANHFTLYMGKTAIIVYSKDECCLCDEAKEVIGKTLEKMGLQNEISVSTVDITEDKALYETYRNDIPVITINGDFAFRHKVHPITLEKKLLRAMNP